MELSNAEMFLGAWAVLATILGGWLWGRAKHHFMAHALMANLLAEVVLGDITPTKDTDGVWTVENDDMRMSFKKKGD